MTGKDFFRKLAAYIILVIGIIFTLACLFSAVAVFFYFPEGIQSKVVLTAVVMVVFAVICAILTYVLFDVLRESGNESSGEERFDWGAPSKNKEVK